MRIVRTSFIIPDKTHNYGQTLYFVEKDILEKYKGITAEALCESAIKNVRILESFDFKLILSSDFAITMNIMPLATA